MIHLPDSLDLCQPHPLPVADVVEATHGLAVLPGRASDLELELISHSLELVVAPLCQLGQLDVDTDNTQ